MSIAKFLNWSSIGSDCDCWVSVYIPLYPISGWKWFREFASSQNTIKLFDLRNSSPFYVRILLKCKQSTTKRLRTRLRMKSQKRFWWKIKGISLANLFLFTRLSEVTGSSFFRNLFLPRIVELFISRWKWKAMIIV